jgi:hypothetical protein
MSLLSLSDPETRFREHRLPGWNPVDSLIPEPSLFSAPFKTHSATVPNGFLQEAVSKTLRRSRLPLPRNLIRRSVPDTALTLNASRAYP